MMGRGQAEAVPSVHPVCPPVDSFIISHSSLLLLGSVVWCALLWYGVINVDYSTAHTHTHANTHARTDRQQACCTV